MHAGSGARHLVLVVLPSRIVVSGGCWKAPETLALGIVHVIERKRILSVANKDRDSDYLPS